MTNLPRVISLLPSATEIVCALGQIDCLVGRSHECDFPEAVRSLPICTETLIDPAAASGELDQKLKELLAAGASPYRLHDQRIREARPDLILTQGQCEVCAVPEAAVHALLADWPGAARTPQVLSLAPSCLADVWRDIETVAAALGVMRAGKELRAQLQQRIAVATEQGGGLARRPTVACIEWMDPLMAAGNWVPEMVELAGGHNLFGRPGQHSPWLSWETLTAHDPEIIVLMPCGFSAERTRQEMHPLTRRAEWPKLRAVRTGRVYVTDGSQYFNRPGPRLVDSLELLVELFHRAPEANLGDRSGAP